MPSYSSASETESDTDDEQVHWTAADFATQFTSPNELASTSSQVKSDLQEAVRSLQESHPVLDEQRIYAASSAILVFLSSIVHEGITFNGDTEETVCIFAEIVHQRFVQSLFEHRHQCLTVAMKSRTNNSGGIMTWADVVLCKLSEAVAVVATNSTDPRECDLPMGPLQELQESDNLQSTTQLPRFWRDVPNLLNSAKSSPGVQRLALRLLFGVYVMAPTLDLNREHDPADDSLKTLSPIFLEYVVSRREEFLDYSPRARLHLSMAITLLATADTCNTDTVTTYDDRPRTRGSLSSAIQDLLQIDLSYMRPWSEPIEDLDGACTIILRWGPVVRWSLALRRDLRAEGVGVITCLTSTWLLHLDPEDELWTGTAYSVLNVSPDPCLAMLAVIHDIAVCMRETEFICSPSHLEVLRRACKCTARLISPDTAIDAEDATVQELGAAILSVYVLLGDAADELSVKTLIVECLTLINTIDLGISLLKATNDIKLQFSRQCETFFSAWTRRLSESLEEGALPEESLDDLHLQLQFASIIVMNDIANVIASEVMMGFLQALTKLCQALFTTSSEALPLDDQEHLASLYVGLLTTTSYWAPGSGSFNAKKDGWLESFWEIATESCRLDLALAGAFAHFVVRVLTQDRARSLLDALDLMEAWTCFCDVLHLIVGKTCIGDEEPLALLVCPTLCRALTAILKIAGHAPAQWMRALPSAHALIRNLEALLAKPQSDNFSKTLGERLRVAGRNLVHTHANQIHQPVNQETRNNVESYYTRLVMCRTPDTNFLLPIQYDE